MADETKPNPETTRAFYEALYPLSLRLNAKRTLSPGKLGVLRHLAQFSRSTTTELANIVQVSQQAISLAVKELEHLGFVARVPDAEDRRRAWIELTPQGEKKLNQELAAGHEWLDQAITERLTPTERATLAAAIPALQKLGLESLHE